MSLHTGDRVRVATGPFMDFVGVVSELDLEKSKVLVRFSFFGRETPVELDFGQIAKL